MLTGSEKWQVTLAYRPPSSTPENNEKLDMLASSLNNSNPILIGNFNYPGIDWRNSTSDSKGRTFLEACIENGLYQLVDFPTHTKGNTLDLVLSNSAEKIRSVTAEQAWCKLRGKLNELTVKYVPTRPRRQADRPPWLTVDLLRQIRRKRRLWKKFRTSPSVENERLYKEEEKSVNKKVRLAKRNMERNIAKSTDGNKQFHAYIRSRTKNKAGVGPLRVGDRTVTSDQEMAETLNDYFSSVFQIEDEREVPQATLREARDRCRYAHFRPTEIKK